MVLSKIQEAAARYPDTVAVQIKEGDRYRQYTYRELLQSIASVARALAEKGIAKGDRVAIFSENRPEWIIADLAIVSSGLVVVPLDAQLTEHEVALLLASSGTKAIFVSSACAQRLPKQFTGIISSFDPGIGVPFSSMLATSPGAVVPPVLRDDDLATILYTSGTTGDPKGVMLSQKNLASNLSSIRKLDLFDHNDNFLLILPLHHTYASMCCMLLPLSLGATITILNSLKGPEILACMRETGVSVLVGVPQLFAAFRRAIYDEIQKKPLLLRVLVKLLLSINSLVRETTGKNIGKTLFKAVHAKFGPRFRVSACGGARLDPDIYTDMHNIGFRILEGYGLTETSPLCTFNLRKPGSIGIPIPDVEVKLANQDETGQGELIVRGPNVMLGYYKKPEETAEVMKDGWFSTGDLAKQDSDGFLYITGRSRELIVLPNGKKIFPEELEKFYKQIPAIKEICLLQGERGIEAAVVPDFDYLRKMNQANARETIAFQIEDLAKNLPAFKRIMGLKIFKDPLPVTRIGKLRRSKVKELYQASGERVEKTVPESDSSWQHDPVAKKLLACLAPFSAKKNIALDDNLELDLGLDSLSRVELVVGIEQSFGVSLPDTFGSEIFTVKDALHKLQDLFASGAMKKSPQKHMSWAEILAQEPADDLKATLSPGTGLLQGAALLLFKYLVGFALRAYGRLSVRGLENIPAQGPFILAPNHLSLVDAPCVMAVLSREITAKTYFLGAVEYFSGPVTSLIARLIHVIPVDMETRLHSAMQMSAYILRKGNVLLAFPEGSRSRDGGIKEFKKGVSIIAKELNVPIVPVAIKGSFEMLASGMRVPRFSKISVTFGKPINPGDLDYERLTKKLYEEVVAML